MGKPLHVFFGSVAPKVVQGNFGNENHLEGLLMSPNVYHTAPTKDGTKYTIEKNEKFTFVVSDALLREIQGTWTLSTKALSLEMYTNESGYTKYMVNLPEGDNENMTYADKDEVPFGASEMNDATIDSSDAKWDAINRKKRLEIAHGQAYNIATMTVNGGNPKSFWVDSSEWRNQVHKVAMTIFPLLVEEPSEPDGTVPNTKKTETVVIKSEKVTADEPKPFEDDELPF